MRVAIVTDSNSGITQEQGRQAGKMCIRDRNIFELSKMVGTVLQDADGQFIGLTVGEDIAFALENDCVDQGKMKDCLLYTSRCV